MNRRQMMARCLAAGAGLAATCAPSLSAWAMPAGRAAPHIVFLNPGESVQGTSGPHWQYVSRFMAATAQRFGMQLEVLYAERDHLLMLRQAESIVARRVAPDYVVIVNEKMTAPSMLQTLARSPAKVLLIHNDLTDAQRAVTGHERGAIPNWIGTITADAQRGSFRLMEYLGQHSGEAPARVIGITGDPATPVSHERAAGAQAALARRPHDQTCQLVYGDWSYADGRDKALVLLARYPQANILWAANDSMTLGALSAVRDRHSSAIVGGFGALPEAVESVMRGDLAAIVAGDQFIGACAMVLIHDYHHGADFALAGGARQRLDYLKVLHDKDAARYNEIVFERHETPDFSAFSRIARLRHGSSRAYDFNLQSMLNTSLNTAVKPVMSPAKNVAIYAAPSAAAGNA
ncbi:ABC-type sugar transport system substrate-binding protein [Paraburkholderia bannensis]|uniref:ABC-type sugar transport system substrate-binding protein n=1 Tax=Paraburkholderia bannensis TaxID=765414 RepID=A0A7W9TV60_9BURK|nr:MULTISPECIES: ABC transporter substrate-binding protein [Paraburkholderia]MBB3256680.1 ABC-type sugar transport system substrate-binding protein [Paraburkholderia sp. WP4_3_2]MBB6101679.1 ABC-type sugar transport system substrate-binding protein [Paraburkholderia bannensis]